MYDIKILYKEIKDSLKQPKKPVDFIKTILEQRNKIFTFLAGLLIFFFVTLFNLIVNHRKITFAILAGLSTSFILLGLFVSDKTGNPLEAFNKTVAIFVLNYPADENFILTLGVFFAIITVFLGVIILFFTGAFNLWAIHAIQNKNFDLIIGLSNQNQLFLDSLKSNNPTLVIESNKTHPGIDKCKRKGFGTLIEDAATALPKLHYVNMKHCVISTGNDRQNIDLALQLLDVLFKQTNKSETATNSKSRWEQWVNFVKDFIFLPNQQDTIAAEKLNPAIYIRVECRDLAVLFKRKVIEHKQNGIDIIVYSLCEAICRQLFSTHPLLGNYPGLVRNKEAFAMVVIGTSELAAELIFQIATLAHLPEQNKVTIYSVSKDAMHFNGTIAKRFPGIGNIPNLHIEPVNLNDQSLDFFTHPLWKKPNLVNIFIANNEQDRNLDIAINLQDTTYIRETATPGNFRTNVFFAMFQHSALEKRIDSNKQAFDNFYSFADLAKVSNKDNIIDENLDRVAKLIHYDWENKLDKEPNVSENDLRSKWLDTTIHNRDSSRAQAIHIDIKLLALGLKKTRSDKNREDLLTINRDIMTSRLPGWDLALEQDKNYQSSYFPKSFDSLLDKIARSEHERWNAFHYAWGWSYGPATLKDAKVHNCLLSLDKFADEEVKKLYKYDLRSVLRIPVYMAHIGYEIVPLEQPVAKPTEQPEVA